MAKQKNKGTKGLPSKHLHSRIAYLHRASTYLAVHAQAHPALGPIESTGAVDHRPNGGGIAGPLIDDAEATEPSIRTKDDSPPKAAGSKHQSKTTVEKSREDAPLPRCPGLATYLASNVRAVALKSQIRLHTDMKHSICKVCDSPLVEGSTSSKSIENLSKGGRKPWADVLCVRCRVCGHKKRFPVGAKRQKRKGERQGKQGRSLPDVSQEGTHVQEK